MSEQHQAEDIRQLTEKVREQNYFFTLLKQEINKAIIGQEYMVDRLLIGLLGNGHVLLEGVPGLAKTLAIKTLADAVQGEFSRIQFTPDLLPADVVGTMMYNIKENDFTIKRGPIFANFVLADEINRTPPKTQSALLEAMQERRVTAAGTTYTLPAPFFVLATQNPIEQEGTYPLPEAQLDRFMFNIWVDYPSYLEELAIVKATTSDQQIELKHILSAEQIMMYQELIRRIPVADNVMEYAVKLVGKTRYASEFAPQLTKDFISWGAGPRASQYLIVGAKCHAALNGKFSPDIEDVKAVAKPILRHRIVRNYKAEAEGYTTDRLIDELM
jgi:MoxR-like ATPase